MSAFFQVALHPTPSVSQRDTSLRYTDILFGFVIKELFVRMQYWMQPQHWNTAVGLQLVAGAVLVLGSWIGYRRSLNRSSWEVKFFNLPLFRFILDQMMLILYFRIAVLTPEQGREAMVMTPNELANDTIVLVVFIFVLYTCWDLLGIWMARAKKDNVRFRYPLVKDNKATDCAEDGDWHGFFISLGFLIVFFVAAALLRFSCLNPKCLLPGIAALLLAYRWAKEMKSGLKEPERTKKEARCQPV